MVRSTTCFRDLQHLVEERDIIVHDVVDAEAARWGPKVSCTSSATPVRSIVNNGICSIREENLSLKDAFAACIFIGSGQLLPFIRLAWVQLDSAREVAFNCEGEERITSR